VQALKTARLVLDAPQEHDIPAVSEACSDPELQTWIPLPSPYTQEDAEYFVRDYCRHGLTSGQYTVWAVRSAEGEPLIGVVEVRRDETPGSASLGCWLAPRARGHGYMREALREVARHSLDPAGLGFNRVRWEHLKENVASRLLAEQVGFRFDPADERTIDFRGQRRAAMVGFLRRDTAADG
jgi:RimJ/RimL family protein N-acetyltransferase